MTYGTLYVTWMNTGALVSLELTVPTAGTRSSGRMNVHHLGEQRKDTYQGEMPDIGREVQVVYISPTQTNGYYNYLSGAGYALTPNSQRLFIPTVLDGPSIIPSSMNEPRSSARASQPTP
jgi:hypothetical protein